MWIDDGVGEIWNTDYLSSISVEDIEKEKIFSIRFSMLGKKTDDSIFVYNDRAARNMKYRQIKEALRDGINFLPEL